MKKISIQGQIQEIEREIALRQGVYPRMVREGKLRQEEANMLMDRALAIRMTLIFCRDNEADIRQFISQKKVSAA